MSTEIDLDTIEPADYDPSDPDPHDSAREVERLMAAVHELEDMVSAAQSDRNRFLRERDAIFARIIRDAGESFGPDRYFVGAPKFYEVSTHPTREAAEMALRAGWFGHEKGGDTP